MSAAIRFAMMWKNGFMNPKPASAHLTSKASTKGTHHDLDHHASVPTLEAAPAGRVHELRDDRPDILVNDSERRGKKRGTHETKNIDTPTGPSPRSANTPAAGKMIIPSIFNPISPSQQQ
jgi:hypothetical protein